MLSTHPEVWITNVLTSSSNRTWLSMLASGLQTVIELSFRDKSVRLHFHLHLFTSTSCALAKTSLYSIRPTQNAESMKPAFCQLACLPLAFLLTPAIFFFSFSACNIYPRHRSSLHTQGDASFCYPIPVFSVRCAWLIFLARSKSHPWSCLWW